MLIINIIFYFACFFLIWYASGIIINSLTRLANHLKLSSFAVSFFVLGILTSIPELAVGVNSIMKGTPDIYVGNLLGATLIMFIFIIPILAVLGGGVKMVHQLTPDHLIFALLVAAAPIFLIADNVLTRTESVFLILLYFILFYYVQKKKGLLERPLNMQSLTGVTVVEDLLEIILATVIIFISSQYLVNQTIYFSSLLSVSPFLISIIVLSLGTNIPELSIAIRSVIEGKKEVALGDYLGSAAANTLLFGILTFFNGSRLNIDSYSYKTMIMMLLGLGLFYFFSRSKHDISKREGKILLMVYVLFLIVEIFAQ